MHAILWFICLSLLWTVKCNTTFVSIFHYNLTFEGIHVQNVAVNLGPAWINLGTLWIAPAYFHTLIYNNKTTLTFDMHKCQPQSSQRIQTQFTTPIQTDCKLQDLWFTNVYQTEVKISMKCRQFIGRTMSQRLSIKHELFDNMFWHSNCHKRTTLDLWYM